MRFQTEFLKKGCIKMTTIQDNQSIYFDLINKGQDALPCLAMVHGFTHNHHYFSAQVAEFQRDYRLFLPDLRGHGQSTNVGGPYGVEEYTDDLVAALDQAGIDKVIYWGTHTGSAIGLVLALRHPQRIAALILEGTFLPGFDMPRVGELIGRARSIAQSAGLQTAREDWFTNADWFAYIQAHPQQCRVEALKELTLAFRGHPWLTSQVPRAVTPAANFLERIFQPALVYNGVEDMPDFQRAAARLAGGLPNVQCAQIPAAGGFPGWENPAAVNELVRRFLERTSDSNK